MVDELFVKEHLNKWTNSDLAVRMTGDDLTLFELSRENRTDLSLDKRSIKKNMIVLYEGGDHLDLILKVTSWLEHSGKFNVCVLALNS